MKRKVVQVNPSRPSLGVRLVATALAFASFGGCNTPADPETGLTAVADEREGAPPNIVLIVACTCRYDHLSPAGYGRPTTPFLNELSENGVFFEDAVSASSWTKASVASLLTGLTPNVHRMTDYYRPRQLRGSGFAPKRTLSEETVTLAECLRDAGYQTGYQNNNIHAGEFFNMTQGFEETGFHDADYDTRQMLNEFEIWLAGLDEEKPFFFFMLTRDLHITYDPDHEVYRRFNRSGASVPSDRRDVRELSRAVRGDIEAFIAARRPVDDALKLQWIDLYDAELAQLDEALSTVPRILRNAGRASNTVIVFTADHGERFFDGLTGGIGHGHELDEPVLRIPMILSGPNTPRGLRVSQAVRSIDVYPTLAAIAGAELPDFIQGRSLLPLMSGDAFTSSSPSAFASYEEKMHAVRKGDYKLHYWGEAVRALFNIRLDPDEHDNLVESHPEIADDLKEELDSWLMEEQALRSLIAAGDMRELTPEVLEQLRSLGYIE